MEDLVVLELLEHLVALQYGVLSCRFFSGIDPCKALTLFVMLASRVSTTLFHLCGRDFSIPVVTAYVGTMYRLGHEHETLHCRIL